MNAGPLITLVLIGAVFYLLLIAPQRRRQRALTEMTRNLEPGVEVMTTAGLYATVRAVHDDEVHLEVAPGVVSRYAKGAIARLITPTEPDEGTSQDQVAGADRELDRADAGVTAADQATAVEVAPVEAQPREAPPVEAPPGEVPPRDGIAADRPPTGSDPPGSRPWGSEPRRAGTEGDSGGSSGEPTTPTQP